jgi:peptidoglycan/LPS O-acetylase OafA/YrhL
MKDELRALTIARFFAAMWVVLYHCGGWPDEIMLVIGAGGIGVPFFFILSGFVLAYTARDLTSSSGRRNFYVRRVARIYPVYLLAWALYGVWLIAHEEQRSALSGGLTATLLQSWVPGMHGEWNSPAWSLSVEALFYAVFPLIYLALARLTSGKLLVVLVVMWIANLGYIVANQTPWGDYAYFLPPLRLPQFAMGAILGLLFVRHGAFVKGWTWTGISVAGVLAITVSRSAMGPWWEAAIAPVFCLLVMALASIDVRGKVSDVGVLLGKASYSIYILQIPIWNLMWMSLGQELDDRRGLAELAMYWVVLVGLSVIVYGCIEAPLEKWIKGRWSQRAPAAALIAT